MHDRARRLVTVAPGADGEDVGPTERLKRLDQALRPVVQHVVIREDADVEAGRT
jgi:hypothetical protein